MSSLESWELLRSKLFEKELKNLLKTLYKKTPEKEFLERLREILKEIKENPYCTNSKSEPSPKNLLKENEELRKYYFKLPRQKGASSEGRIIYKVNKKEKKIYLLIIYTHQKYAKRPPDDIIRKANE